MQLDQIVPLGRSAADYRAMFALGPDDLGRRLLGCGDGPAAFNADWTAAGGQVVSLDPLYAWPAEVIEDRIAESFCTVLRKMRAASERFALAPGDTVDALAGRRWTAMQRFLEDFLVGGRAGRYVAGALPHLPFQDDAFDLAVCSHLLFLYEDELSRAFHLRAVRSLLGVAAEVRVFPLVNLDAHPSAHLEAVLAALDGQGMTGEVVPVAYEVQRGANHMLRITRRPSARAPGSPKEGDTA